MDETLGINFTIIFASFLFIGETFLFLRFTCMLIFPSTKLLRFCVQAFYKLQVIKFTGFPLGLEKLENLEKWEGIFQSGKSQGILNRLEKSGKSQGKPHKILEN